MILFIDIKEPNYKEDMIAMFENNVFTINGDNIPKCIVGFVDTDSKLDYNYEKIQIGLKRYTFAQSMNEFYTRLDPNSIKLTKINIVDLIEVN